MNLLIHSQISTAAPLKWEWTQFHLTLYNEHNYLSMLGLKIIHISKRTLWSCLKQASHKYIFVSFLSYGVEAVKSFPIHDDVIKWKHFPRYWTFVRGIHRWPVNSPHKGQWRGALMFALICAWINASVNNREACDLRRYRVHYDVTAMIYQVPVYHALSIL